MNASPALSEAPVAPLIARRPAAAGRKGASAPGAFSQPLVPIVTAAGVAVLVVTAISLFRSAELIVALWGASALAVAVWLRAGKGLSFDLSFGGVIAVGVLVGELLAGNRPDIALMFTVANMVEIVAAVVLARRFAPGLNLSTVRGALGFLAATAVAAPAPAALIGAMGMQALLGGDFLTSFQTWWFGHALGLAVLTPFCLTLQRRHWLVLRKPWRMLEIALLFSVLIGLCALTMVFSSLPLGFAFIPALILIAVRLRIPGITAALLLVAVFSMASVVGGLGPYRAFTLDLPERAVLAQLTLLFGYVPVLLVASLLEEHDRLADRARAGKERAERASAAKSRLLANVAHEIKSPVGGVIGIGELWQTGQLGPVTDTQREMADMLVKTARQVETLAHDLLDVARAESGAVKVEMRPVDVAGVLDDVRRSIAMRPEAQGLRLELVSEEGLIALADSQRLTQVIGNLAVNAVKYGGSGGQVTFRASRAENGAVRVEVADRGPGLTPEKQSQLFEPFNRLGLERSAVEGHGIGLALSKRLVELMGGSIGVMSSPGEGAVFWVELRAA